MKFPAGTMRIQAAGAGSVRSQRAEITIAQIPCGASLPQCSVSLNIPAYFRSPSGQLHHCRIENTIKTGRRLQMDSWLFFQSIPFASPLFQSIQHKRCEKSTFIGKPLISVNWWASHIGSRIKLTIIDFFLKSA